MVWYRERSSRVAESLASELGKAVQAISNAPQRWPRYEHGCRRFPLRRFPYLLIYREKAEAIQLLAVAHGRRRPGFWRARVTVGRS